MNAKDIDVRERRAILSLASIFSFRMLGLFMIYPIFTLYAANLKGSTPTLIGVALGIYGLTQALLQIPFGILSDKVGRKKIITIGLLIFCAGSIVAALSHSAVLLLPSHTVQCGATLSHSAVLPSHTVRCCGTLAQCCAAALAQCCAAAHTVP